MLLFVEEDAARRIKLFEKVEINNVASQNRAAVLSGSRKKQSIIQCSSPMVPAISLQTGENTR